MRVHYFFVVLIHNGLFLEQCSMAESIGSCVASPGSNEESCTNDKEQLDWADNAPRLPARPDDSELHSEAPSELSGVDDEHMHGLLGRLPNGSLRYQAVELPPNGLSKKERRAAHRGFCFNSRVSDSLPLDRPQRDFRSKACRKRHADFPQRLPVATIIFVFHNENLSVLLRSVHSVLNRSPAKLVAQVILVDDASTPTQGRFSKKNWRRLQEELDSHCRALPKMLLVRLRTRRGLMLARMEGAWRATGDVLIFLDSHIEATTGWLEPLLARIAENRTRLLVPQVDNIDAETFRMDTAGLGVVGFSWALGQKPEAPDYGRDGTIPSPSPVMPGGLFAADRQWFLHLGGYDAEMRLYGGEEMEISFRTWMCGGSVESVPCSHVGHVFRTDAYWQGQVYVVPGVEIHRNKLRTAHVWMDGYKRFVEYAMEPMDPGTLGNLSARKELRKKLKCRSFSWFLRNVVPHMEVPNVPKKGPMGSLVNEGLKGVCLDLMGKNQPGEQLGLYPCHGKRGSQAFAMDREGLLRIPTQDYQMCVMPHKGKAVQSPCHGSMSPDDTDADDKLQWSWKPESGMLVNSAGGCLAGASLKNGGAKLGVAPCRDTAAGQRWSWQ